jgi:hypothetical protein
MAEAGALLSSLFEGVAQTGAQAGAGAGMQAGTAAAANPWAATVTPAAAAAGPSWSSIAGNIGTGLQVGGLLAQGAAAKESGVFEAEQLKKKAAEERAAASRAAQEKRMDMNRVISRQVAVAAAGGAGTSNASIFDIIGDTAARGQYLFDTEIAGGESKASGWLDKAIAAKSKGNNAFIGSIFDAGTTLAKGVHKAKYG